MYILYQILNNENLKSKILLDAFQGKLSKYNEADTTLRKMLNNIKNEKKYFLIKQEKLQKNRIKIIKKITLLSNELKRRK